MAKTHEFEFHLQNCATSWSLAVFDFLDLMASFELFDFCDDILAKREALTFQLGKDQGPIEHHFEG